MKQKLLIFLALIFLIILLVALNAASFVQKEKTPDSEYNPNRSTYNAGATGTRAFYELLSETGRKPVRWQEPMSALLGGGKNKPATFVVIGKTRREFDDKEIEQILRWVSEGGKLVIIDREPPAELIKTTANWSVSFDSEIEPTLFAVDPSDQKQMTEKIAAAKPVQPTVFTRGVNAVQPSRFASAAEFEHFFDVGSSPKSIVVAPSPRTSVEKDEDYYDEEPAASPPAKIPEKSGQGSGIGSGNSSPPPPEVETVAVSAPVAHLSSNDKTLLIDFPFSSGEIVFLTDPYIVSNGGINLVDNAQLATNVVASGGGGTIAFDEFHQGFGANENQLLAYFSGTPVVPIFLQIAALAAFVLFSQSRRFARALPADEPNRLSKLEYVSAMAELQRRVKAYDLAIENIYADFRRRAARMLGVDNFTISLKELAQLVAERAKLNHAEVENLMFKCEEIIRGEPTNKKEVLELTARIREIEEKLGLKRKRTARR